MKKIEIEDAKGSSIPIFEKYYRYFKDFKGKPDLKFSLPPRKNPFELLISFDFYIREKIFPYIEDFLILHSSSISNGKHSFLIGGRAGSGKSTLSFLLSKRFFYMGDDITPLVFRDKILAHPYPQPVSIYKDLKKFIDKQECIEQRNYTKIFVFPENIINNFPLPVKAFIFPIPSRKNKVKPMKKSMSFLYLSGIFVNSKVYIKKRDLKDLKRFVEEIPFYKIFWNSFEYLKEKASEIVERF